MSVEQQMEKHSGTGYRSSHYCAMSISDSKEDIYLCENATDFYLRFGALPWNHSGGNDKYTQTASAETSIPVFPHSSHWPVYFGNAELGRRNSEQVLGRMAQRFRKLCSKHQTSLLEQDTEAVSQFGGWILHISIDRTCQPGERAQSVVWCVWKWCDL